MKQKILKEDCQGDESETEEERRIKERKANRRRISEEFLEGTPPPQGYLGVRMRGRFKQKAKRSVCNACGQHIDNYDWDCVFLGFKLEGETQACRRYYHGTVECLQKLPSFGREEFLETTCPNIDVHELKPVLKKIWRKEEKEKYGISDSDATVFGDDASDG